MVRVDPIVPCCVAVELGVLETDAGVRVFVHGGVPERAVELLVADFREQRRDADVRHLDVLQVPLQHEGDLDGALRGARGASHRRRVAGFVLARQGAGAAGSAASIPGETPGYLATFRQRAITRRAARPRPAWGRSLRTTVRGARRPRRWRS